MIKTIDLVAVSTKSYPYICLALAVTPFNGPTLIVKIILSLSFKALSHFLAA